jgi:hypothetical protein
MNLKELLASLPSELAEALERTFLDATDHFLKEEWDDCQVDGGRFAEAVLRYLQWRQKGSFTPIDGRSKPNRKSVVTKVTQDPELPSSLRTQVVQAVELVMDFRNNRNSAHLGDIDANRLDAVTVIQLVQWILGEIVRLETQAGAQEIQAVIDDLAQPYLPLVQFVEDQPTVLDSNMEAANKVLILLYQCGGRASVDDLRGWAEYANSSRWRKGVLGGLAKEKKVQVRGDQVHLLHPGHARAQRLLVEHGASNRRNR